MPYCGKKMDRKANASRARYRAQTECLTHGRMLEWCRPLDGLAARTDGWKGKVGQ